MRLIFQLDKPGGLRDIWLANMEEQDDVNNRWEISIAEHLIATKANRQGLEDNGART